MTVLALMGIVMLPAARPAARAQDVALATTLHAFTGSDGATPGDGLAQASDGNFYGTTMRGGLYGWGTVFVVTAAGELTTLHSFQGPDGSRPAARVVQGGDGGFYGTTSTGGDYGLGTIFRITSAGGFTLLHSFEGTDGSTPVAALVQGPDGNFYGTTAAGGNDNVLCPAGCGAVFQITPAGAFTLLHLFEGDDGASPQSSLIPGSDGNLYGTTVDGGTNAYGGTGFSGTFYQVTPEGVLTSLYSFEDDNSGSEPNGLVLGSDGNFYGTTSAGGANNIDYGGDGTIFRLTPSGEYTLLYSFDDPNRPQSHAVLVQGSDGNFYGTNGQTVFQVTPVGSYTTLGYYGPGVLSALVQGSDGNFYGTAAVGSDGVGTESVFKLTVAAIPSSFFAGETPLVNGVYYLAFPSGNYFGYYSYMAGLRVIYHFDLGYEYVFDAADGQDGVYFYDFASGDYFYTSPAFPFPYLYDFGLNSVVYYYPDPDADFYPDSEHAGHYNTDGVRYFYVFSTGQIISK